MPRHTLSKKQYICTLKTRCKGTQLNSRKKKSQKGFKDGRSCDVTRLRIQESQKGKQTNEQKHITLYVIKDQEPKREQVSWG